MEGHYSAKKGNIFRKKKQVQVKNLYMVCVFYHSIRLTKNIKKKKFVISGRGHK